MFVSEISASAQDYLKSIWALEEWGNEPVTSKQLAEYMGLKASSVSDAVKKLSQLELLEHAPYGAITLSEKGRVLAVSMIRRHRLIETFLVEQLGYTWDQVHDEAENLEHAVSEYFVDQLDRVLNFPLFDPHGDPIPNALGEIQKMDAVCLNTLKPTQQAIIRRISDSSAEVLKFLSAQGATIGSKITVLNTDRLATKFDIRLEDSGAIFQLNQPKAAKVFVEVLP